MVTLVYRESCSITVTVWVPIVAVLLVETEIRPAGLIVVSAVVNALAALKGVLLIEYVIPPQSPLAACEVLTASMAVGAV